MKEFAKKLETYFRLAPIERKIFYERRPHQYDSQDIEKLRIITHQNLVRATGAMFLEEPHLTTRTFRDLSAKVGKEFFVDQDKESIYFAAASALFRLEHAFNKKIIDSAYKPARFQILLAARLVMDAGNLPPFNSKDMDKRCVAMLEIIWGKDFENVLQNACGIVDAVAGKCNRDSIRTEPVTAGILAEFGHKKHADGAAHAKA